MTLLRAITHLETRDIMEILSDAHKAQRLEGRAVTSFRAPAYPPRPRSFDYPPCDLPTEDRQYLQYHMHVSELPHLAALLGLRLAADQAPYRSRYQ